jgi:hypothetical protein
MVRRTATAANGCGSPALSVRHNGNKTIHGGLDHLAYGHTLTGGTLPPLRLADDYVVELDLGITWDPSATEAWVVQREGEAVSYCNPMGSGDSVGINEDGR